MKRLIFPLVLITAALSGCTVMAPYEQPYGTYAVTPYYGQPYYAQPYYGQPYALAPGYAAPLYDYPVYVGPPVQFSFSLDYRSHGRHGFHRGFRHGYGVHGGFRGHGFPGGRHGWRR